MLILYYYALLFFMLQCSIIYSCPVGFGGASCQIVLIPNGFGEYQCPPAYYNYPLCDQTIIPNDDGAQCNTAFGTDNTFENFPVSYTGMYIISLWGAAGSTTSHGIYPGGTGGYISISINMQIGEEYYFFSGFPGPISSLGTTDAAHTPGTPAGGQCGGSGALSVNCLVGAGGGASYVYKATSNPNRLNLIASAGGGGGVVDCSANGNPLISAKTLNGISAANYTTVGGSVCQTNFLGITIPPANGRGGVGLDGNASTWNFPYGGSGGGCGGGTKFIPSGIYYNSSLAQLHQTFLSPTDPDVVLFDGCGRGLKNVDFFSANGYNGFDGLGCSNDGVSTQGLAVIGEVGAYSFTPYNDSYGFAVNGTCFMAPAPFDCVDYGLNYNLITTADGGCACPTGTYGNNCIQNYCNDLTPYTSADCNGKGTCTAYALSGQCTCNNSTYYGGRCQYINGCNVIPNPCTTGFICTNTTNTGSITCLCPIGYTGSQCQTLIPISSSQTPFSSSITPFSSSRTPFSSSITPFSSSITPFSSSQTPFSSSVTPFSSSITPFSSSQTPFSSSSQTPFSSSQDPTTICSQGNSACVNGATCVENATIARGYSCTCITGFVGVNCQMVLLSDGFGGYQCPVAYYNYPLCNKAIFDTTSGAQCNTYIWSLTTPFSPPTTGLYVISAWGGAGAGSGSTWGGNGAYISVMLTMTIGETYIFDSGLDDEETQPPSLGEKGGASFTGNCIVNAGGEGTMVYKQDANTNFLTLIVAAGAGGGSLDCTTNVNSVIRSRTMNGISAVTTVTNTGTSCNFTSAFNALSAVNGQGSIGLDGTIGSINSYGSSGGGCGGGVGLNAAGSYYNSSIAQLLSNSILIGDLSSPYPCRPNVLNDYFGYTSPASPATGGGASADGCGGGNGGGGNVGSVTIGNLNAYEFYPVTNSYGFIVNGTCAMAFTNNGGSYPSYDCTNFGQFPNMLTNNTLCVCPTGTYGLNCLQNYCNHPGPNSGDCNNVGTCIAHALSGQCTCNNSTYYGGRCQYINGCNKVNACPPTYICSNTSTTGSVSCAQTIFSSFSSSNPPFSSSFTPFSSSQDPTTICQTNNPCVNNGVCSENNTVTNGYTCKCSQLFAGINCQIVLFIPDGFGGLQCPPAFYNYPLCDKTIIPVDSGAQCFTLLPHNSVSTAFSPSKTGLHIISLWGGSGGASSVGGGVTSGGSGGYISVSVNMTIGEIYRFNSAFAGVMPTGLGTTAAAHTPGPQNGGQCGGAGALSTNCFVSSGAGASYFYKLTSSVANPTILTLVATAGGGGGSIDCSTNADVLIQPKSSNGISSVNYTTIGGAACITYSTTASNTAFGKGAVGLDGTESNSPYGGSGGGCGGGINFIPSGLYYNSTLANLIQTFLASNDPKATLLDSCNRGLSVIDYFSPYTNAFLGPIGCSGVGVSGTNGYSIIGEANAYTLTPFSNLYGFSVSGTCFMSSVPFNCSYANANLISSNGGCICPLGKYGVNCSLSYCYDSSIGTSTDCSGRGTCVASALNGTCTCNTPYFGGRCQNTPYSSSQIPFSSSQTPFSSSQTPNQGNI